MAMNLPSKRMISIVTPEGYPDILGEICWSESEKCYVFFLCGVRFGLKTSFVDEAIFSPEVIGLVCDKLTNHLKIFAMYGLYPPKEEVDSKIMSLKNFNQKPKPD